MPLPRLSDLPPESVVVLCGAGISVSAGIPDFRSPGTGLYSKLEAYALPQPTSMFSLDYYPLRPRPFHSLSRFLFPSFKYHPTPAHAFFRLLERHGLLRKVYTQNVDSLEVQAGVSPSRVVQCHGGYLSGLYCLGSRAGSCSYRTQSEDSFRAACLDDSTCHCPKCGCVLKPYIVFFGEALPDAFQGALEDLPSDRTRLVLVMGTSLQVAPFKHLPEATNKEAARVLVNSTVRGFIYEDLEDFARGFRLDGQRKIQVKKALEARRVLREHTSGLREAEGGDVAVEDVEDSSSILRCVPTPDPAAPLPTAGSALEELDLLPAQKIAADPTFTARALLQVSPLDFFMGGPCDDSVRALCRASGWEEELDELKQELDMRFEELYAEEQIQQQDPGSKDLRLTLLAYRNSLVTPISAKVLFISSDCGSTLSIVNRDAVFSGMLGLATESQLSNMRAAGCLTAETCRVDLSQLPDEVRSELMSCDPRCVARPGPGQLEIFVADKVIPRPVYAPINGHWASYCHSFVGAVGRGVDVWDAATRLPGTTTRPELEAQTMRGAAGADEAGSWRDASSPPELQSAIDLRPLEVDSGIFDSDEVRLGLVRSSFLSRRLSGAPDSAEAGELCKTSLVRGKRFLIRLAPKYADEAQELREKLQRKAEAARVALQDATRLHALDISIESAQGDGRVAKAGETPEERLLHGPHVLVIVEYDAAVLRDGREGEVQTQARAVFQRMAGDGLKALSVEYQPPA